MGLIEATKSGFAKYTDFSGRASRSEYWYWVLFCFLAAFVLGFIEGFVKAAKGYPLSHGHGTYLGNCFLLVTLIPSWAVGVRRLHDVDHSGWWMLIDITILGALFPHFIWNIRRGTSGDNRFGTDPLAV